MSDRPRDDSRPVDLLVVGAGPVGLACAIAARRLGLTARIVDKGALVNSIVTYTTPNQYEHPTPCTYLRLLSLLTEQTNCYTNRNHS